MTSSNETGDGLVVLAVDDEPGALSELVYHLENERRIGTVYSAATATEALAMMRGDSGTDVALDVVFLDIRMPGLDGFELARMLRMVERAPVLVFVTAYEDRALEAFDIGAVDYLWKPLSPERLADTMHRVLRVLGPAASLDRAAPASGANGSEAPGGELTGDEEVIPVELAGTTKLVARSSVRWVEAQGDYARLHTGEGSHLVRIPLSQLEDRWSDAGFVRIHRSYLVSLPLVSELRMSASGYVVVIGSGAEATELPVSRRHTRALKDRLVKAAKQGWGSR